MRYLFFIFLIFQLPLLGFSQVLKDSVFVDHILSVRLYPQGSEFANQLNSPLITLGEDRGLQLIFDDLAYDPELYTAKLIHCDANWQKSALRDTDFSLGFNQFTIQDYSYSVNTRVPYIHYSLAVPKVSKSGNYVLMVYKNRNEALPVLTKRFMVLENLAPVAAVLVPPTQTEDRTALQQLNATVNYSKLEVIDPKTQVKVLIRQNQHWDRIKFLQAPTFLNQSSKLLRYESFNGENTFRAGNEFRFVDLRFIRSRGVNVAFIKVEESIVLADAMVDQPRPSIAYNQYLDLNGLYLVQTLDRPGGNPEVESEYVYTTFYLKDDPGKEIVLLGALSQWGRIPEAKMVFDTKKEMYSTTLLLKQGWYDYQFAYTSKSGDLNSEPLEGSYFQTENEYEVFVYYRGLGSRYDQLVGYANLRPNKRRF